MRKLIPLLLLLACLDDDVDEDGFAAGEDCDDRDAATYPGAPEICDEVDNDCDGRIDEAAVDGPRWFADNDGDAYGSELSTTIACLPPGGRYIDRGQDCNDSDASVFPGAPETCDQADEDCDGDIDEGGVCGEVFCSDGLDDDGDGLIDCLDPDCDGACLEACDDARDNDGDGPIDCADDDCWDAPHCREVDCSDGVDDELDGLTDCDDPDCWGAACPDVLWRITAGSAAVGRETEVWTERGCEGEGCGSGVDRVQEVQTYDVRGEIVRFTGESWRTCTFSYDSGRYFERIQDNQVVEYSVIREGFSLQAGCGVPDSRFLPRRLVLVGQDLNHPFGGTWLQGDAFEVQRRISDIEDPIRSGTITRDALFLDPLTAPIPPLGSCPDGVAQVGWLDADGDGVGDDGPGVPHCGDETLLPEPGDCFPEDADLPGPIEVCGNGLDDDCDGTAPTCAGPGGEGSLDALPWSLDVGSAGQGLRPFRVGDLDGDGRDDLAIAVPTLDGERGGVVLIDGDITWRGTLDVEDMTWTGTFAGDLFGAVVTPVADHSGDGLPDLLVGGTGAIYEGVDRSGAVWLLPGDGSRSPDRPLAVVQGRGAWVGTWADEIGDVNGDGFPDVAIGAQTDGTYDVQAGAVHVFAGPLRGELSLDDARWTLTGVARNDIVGDAFAGPGDLDGDGLPDLVIGHRKANNLDDEAGAAHLFLSPLPQVADLDQADATWAGAWAEAWAGEHVEAAGDVDGDGYRDVWVAAPRRWGVNPRPIAATGEVYLLRGGPVPTDGDLADADAVIRADRVYDVAGASVSGDQDVDGDGYPDVLIGAPGDDRGAPNGGVMAVFLGGPDLQGQYLLRDAAGSWRGHSELAQVGQWVTLPGDLDGDGFGDLISAALGESALEAPRILGVRGGVGW